MANKLFTKNGTAYPISDEDVQLSDGSTLRSAISGGTIGGASVVDNLTGSGTTVAPSVRAVNEALSSKPDVVDNVTDDSTVKAPSVHAVKTALSGVTSQIASKAEVVNNVTDTSTTKAPSVGAVNTALAGKQAKLTAGNNITIDGNGTISAHVVVSGGTAQDAGQVLYDSGVTYSDGTVGSELTNLVQDSQNIQSYKKFSEDLQNSIKIDSGSTDLDNINIYSDDETDLIVSIDQDGIKAKGYYDLSGNTILDNINRSVSIQYSHNDYFDYESSKWIFDNYLNEKYFGQESAITNNFINKIQNRSGLKFVVISDTHGTGAYTIESNDSCYRSISIFNKILPYCILGIHCGDISCDYGTSKDRYLAYANNIVKKFNTGKPLLFTKGNHDENNNVYSECSRFDIDWNLQHYKRNFSEFTQINKEEWRGEDLYIYEKKLITDTEFKNFVQYHGCPTSSVWGNGAYFYYDIESYKVRFIVGNSFPVNDYGAISEDEEYIWLAEKALNFSEKENPQDWSVIMIRHTQSTSITNLSNCINAFQNGTVWSYGDNTYDFSEINGGAMTFIAHIHGHEHGQTFSNSENYFDIGEYASFVDINSLGDASTYGISVWTIDTDSKKAYEDFINGNTLTYNYATGLLEINVGDTFNVAESGLSPRPITGISNDNNIASCNGRVVTAISNGETFITVSNSANTKSLIYKIKVI